MSKQKDRLDRTVSIYLPTLIAEIMRQTGCSKEHAARTVGLAIKEQLECRKMQLNYRLKDVEYSLQNNAEDFGLFDE